MAAARLERNPRRQLGAVGRPEMDAARQINLTSEKARFFTAMELSGYFQAALLEALS